MSIRYETLAVFIGPEIVTGNVSSGDIRQLSRVQSTNYQIEIQRNNVMGLGTAYANDGNVDAPFVNLTIDYLVTNGRNEKTLGLIVDGKHGSFFNLNSGERDFFLLVNKPIENPIVLGIGNGILTRYSVNASINDFVRATTEIRGFNIRLDEGTSGNLLPSVNLDGLESSYTYQLPPVNIDMQEREVGYIEDNIYVGPRHLDIRFPNDSALGIIMSGVDKSHLQNFTLSLGVNRAEMNRIGDKYPFKRCLQLPMELTLSTSLILEEYVADKIQNYLCQASYDFDINIKDSKCETIDKFWETQEDGVRLKYMFRGMKLKSFTSSVSISEKKNVTLEWSVPIGNLLDLKRNLFISGDYGRYQFPLESSRLVSGEDVTGQNLRAAARELIYKRTRVDVEYPDFNVSFSGAFPITSEDPSYAVFWEGSTGIISGSGNFGSSLSESTYIWNSDSYNTSFDGLPTDNFAKKTTLFNPKYPTGYPTTQDRPSGEYIFVTEGVGYHTEPIEISFAGLPTWAEVAIDYNRFQLNFEKPNFFNNLYFGVNDVSIPTGEDFQFQMIAKNTKFKKVYTIQAQTPYSFHISLPNLYKKKTSLFFEPYNEITINRDANNFVSSIKNNTLRSDTFMSISGSGTNPSYQYKNLNDKSYLRFESGAKMRAVGAWLQDFRNFTFFAVYKPTPQCDSGAALIQFYHTGQSGIANTANFAFFGMKDLSQDLEFYYINPVNTSGLSGIRTNKLQVTSTWDQNNWNLATIVFDGIHASGRRNGNVVGTQVINISGSGYFSNVDIGSGFYGDIAEIILMPFRCTDDECTDVENLLRYKWGI